MHGFIVETQGYEETALLAWNEARPDCDVFFFRVVGPIDPYRSAIQTPDFIRSFDLTPIDDDAFYAYVEQTPRDVDREFQTAFTRHPSHRDRRRDRRASGMCRQYGVASPPKSGTSAGHVLPEVAVDADSPPMIGRVNPT
ncbi:MAG: hypothetical protein V5A21_00840 [Halapricum sp.]